MADDPWNLDRFVDAQSGVMDAVLKELRAGRKQTHWMWFVFPQLKGLGRSPTAQAYGLAGLPEARAYVGHPLLGPRLEAAVAAAQGSPAASLNALFGSPDDLKFRSSMTLFHLAASEGPYKAALDRWGQDADLRTLALVASQDDPGGG